MRAGQPEELEAPEPWERQPHEPDKAFAYFRMYRDLPAGRRSLRVSCFRTSAPRVPNIVRLDRPWRGL